MQDPCSRIGQKTVSKTDLKFDTVESLLYSTGLDYDRCANGQNNKGLLNADIRIGQVG